MTRGFVFPDGDGVCVRLRVSPGAKSTGLQGTHGDALKLRVAAPPVDGKANAEVERFLAYLIGVPPSNVKVRRGQMSRDKVVFAGGVDEAGARKGLSSHLP